MSFIENSAPDLNLLSIVYHHLSKWRRSGWKFISLNYSIMYLFFLFLNLSTNVSRSLSNSLSFPSMDILVRASKFLWTIWIFNVICAVCNRRWTRWFRFTTFNKTKSKSSNTISIVAVSLTFDFTNADFIIILIEFLLFRCHKKRINWQCLWCLQKA